MNLETRIRSTAIRHFSSAAYLEKQRAKARKRRQGRGEAPTVHYFHQVDDPYSHLAVQKLDELKAHYGLTFAAHLVSAPSAAYQGSATHFAQWARQDALHIATAYGIEFRAQVATPAVSAIADANQALATHLNQPDFAEVAAQIGAALWAGKSIESETAHSLGASAVEQGNNRRRKLGHYQGAMFYFDGEWFWGVDRIRLLEQRLRDEGYAQSNGALCVPEPTPLDASNAGADVVLEYFPSLRSPYTAIGHQRVLDLIASCDVTVKVRPVMPMLMRGIPAPRAKQRYIITDAAREGRSRGVPFGSIVDPFGEPVKRAFALFPAASAAGRGMAFISAYLQAAWFDGVDITGSKGLQQVVHNAGLDWQQLQNYTAEQSWEAELEANLGAMTEHSLWGVPSFRVSGGKLSEPYACWGQDRIWRVANDIAARAQHG